MASGTEGSNPSLSTGESDANSTSVSLRDRNRSAPKGKSVVELPVLREAEICEGTGNRKGQPTHPEWNA